MSEYVAPKSHTRAKKLGSPALLYYETVIAAE